MGRILVAGIGNIFLGDDGFGVEVARRLRDCPLGDHVDVADFGIRGVHLAYELAGGDYDAAILVDAVSRGGAPGTVYAIEADDATSDSEPAALADAVVSDAHSLTPGAVLAWLQRAGGRPGRIVVVGCEPAATEESMELSAPVAASIEVAIDMIRNLVADMTRAGAASCA
jgi:hydrogenase maturation protease